MHFGRIFESRYRVRLFHQFLPRVGLTGAGLIQFYGTCAKREEGKPWEVDSSDRKQTVDVSNTTVHEIKRKR